MVTVKLYKYVGPPYCWAEICWLVLLRWQEFGTRSVAMFFFDIPPWCRCQWQKSVGVKARVVNRKHMDVAGASRWQESSGCPGMCQLLTERDRRGCTR